MQICQEPFFPSWGTPPKPPKRIICSLGAIYPAVNESWPFVNHKKPLTEEEADKLCFDLTNYKWPDGYAALYVVINPGGRLEVLYYEL